MQPDYFRKYDVITAEGNFLSSTNYYKKGISFRAVIILQKGTSFYVMWLLQKGISFRGVITLQKGISFRDVIILHGTLITADLSWCETS